MDCVGTRCAGEEIAVKTNDGRGMETSELDQWR